ncbi:MAG: DUF5602 domain-containing protein [Stellaceae bacterium]
MFRNALVALGILALTAAPGFARGLEQAPPPAPYKKVSTLVPRPSFLPGIGILYVDPKTLPEGPWLAYDREGKLVSTIYMILLKDFDQHQNLVDLAAPGGPVDHVSLYYNAGHPGVPEPHYHIVLSSGPPVRAAAMSGL